mgnify:FL=1
MQNNTPKLIVEINKDDFIFIYGKSDENFNFELIQEVKVPLNGIENKKIKDTQLVGKIIKGNIFEIEKKINFAFKDIILIINNFNCSIINFTGYKKLNGAQLEKENITYILNSLKSKISEIEAQKTILHIFNSKYFLDKKKIENLPVGLFGNFYSQELSFFLIEKNDFENIQNIFNKCNLKIKNIISKNYLDGVNMINDDSKQETFFIVEINKDNSEIIFFEDSSLRFVQNFEFGTDIIINDISKVVALDIQTIKNILHDLEFNNEKIENEIIEKEYFKNNNFRKIKKNLIYEIAKARIQEIAEIMLFKNINMSSFIKKQSNLFLKINDKSSHKCFKNAYQFAFSYKNNSQLKFVENFSRESIYDSALKLVHYGWKKEAVPVIREKKTILARIFNLIFN